MSYLYAYYKMPRISRTPSPPREYLRRRQDMGGASLPPMPEDESYLTEYHSSPDPEASRPRKKLRKRTAKTFRAIKQRPKNGPVSWDRIYSDVEDDGEMLDSIVVEGGVLNARLNHARDPTQKNKVVAQKIRSRRQTVTPTPIGETLEVHGSGMQEEHGGEALEGHSGETQEEHGGEMQKEHGGETLERHSGETQKEHGGEALEEHGGEALEEHSGETQEEHGGETQEEHGGESQEEYGSETLEEHGGETQTASAPTEPESSAISSEVNVPTPTVSTPTRKPAKRKTVKYVRPYQPPVATTPQLASEPIEATGSITQPDTQTTASEPIETTGSITLPDTQITAQAIPLHQPVEQSASAPNVHLQQEQHNAIEIDESNHTPVTQSHKSTPPAAKDSPGIISGSSPVRRSARHSVPSIKARAIDATPSPSLSRSSLVFNVCRIETNPSSPSRPFKIPGADFIRGARWMWSQLFSMITECTRFDPDKDEILLNWTTCLPKIEMLKEQQKEMIDMGENEILVVRTENGHYPEWIYDKVKERRRQATKERRRQRDKEREVVEERGITGSNDGIDIAPMEDEVDMSDALPVMNLLPSTCSVERLAPEDEGVLEIEAISEPISAPVSGESAELGQVAISSLGTEKEKSTMSKLRSTPEVVSPLPPLEKEPEILDNGEFFDDGKASGGTVPQTAREGTPPATFTPLNEPEKSQEASTTISTAPEVQPQDNSLHSASAQSPPVIAPDLAVTAVPPIQATVVDGAPAKNDTPPPRNPPSHRGRPIPMPPAYNRPANVAPRPAFDPVPMAADAAASKELQTATIPTESTAPVTAAAAPLPATNAPVRKLSSRKPSPASPTVTTLGVLKSRGGSAELPPEVIAVAQTPLAKWLAKQGGPTVLPKAIAKVGKDTSPGAVAQVPSSRNRPGRPSATIRKVIEAAVGAQSAQKEREAAIRPRVAPSVSQHTPVASQQRLATPDPADTRSETTSPLSSYPSSFASMSPRNTYPRRTANIPTDSASATREATPSRHLPATFQPSPSPVNKSSASFSTPSSLSKTLDTNQKPPATAIDNTTVTPSTPPPALTLCSAQTTVETQPEGDGGDSDSDLDLNLDLHLLPREKKETRVPSWVKTKTPVAKGRLSLAGKLVGFPLPTSSTTTPKAAGPVKTLDDARRATWGGEPPVLGFLVRGQELDLDIGAEATMDDDDDDNMDIDMDMGLDLQRGIKRSRASMSSPSTIGSSPGKSKSKILQPMRFSRSSAKAPKPISTLRSRSKSKSKVKRPRTEGGFGRAGSRNGEEEEDSEGFEEGFLSWEGDEKGMGALKEKSMGEERREGEEEDLDLGF